MQITDVSQIEHFVSDCGKSAQSLRFSTSYATPEFKNFGFDFALPIEAKQLAALLRKVADDLDK